MPHLSISRRAPLPEPLSYAHSRVSQDGRRAVAVGERSGRLWMLELDPRRRTCEVRPTLIVVPRRTDRDDWRVHALSGSYELERVLVWTDQARVHALPSGSVVAELGRMPGRAVCLSPGGRWALRLGPGAGAAMDLEAPVPRWSQTQTFHQMERAPGGGGTEDLLLDHVDHVVAHPCQGAPVPEAEESFWLAAGCYGFVVTHRVHASPCGGVQRVAGESRGFSQGIVYDPTELLQPWGDRYAFVWHGYGSGLAALDPATGELHHCRLRAPGQQPYGFFSGVVPCGQAPLAWGSSGDGAFLWRVGHDPVHVPNAPGLVLALYPDALLCLSSDGGELLWCDLPGTWR